MSTGRIIKFKSRTNKNISDKHVTLSHRKTAMMDVDLITSDGKKVSVHRFVLAMFSKVMVNDLGDNQVNGLSLIPLNLPFEVAKKIVQLLYFKEIMVSPEILVSQVENALKLLKINGTETVDPNAEQLKKSTDVQMHQTILQGNSMVHQSVNQSATSQMVSYIPGKRSRAQSTFVESSPRELHPQIAAKAPIPSGNSKLCTKTPGANPQLDITNAGRPLNATRNQTLNPALIVKAQKVKELNAVLNGPVVTGSPNVGIEIPGIHVSHLNVTKVVRSINGTQTSNSSSGTTPNVVGTSGNLQSVSNVSHLSGSSNSSVKFADFNYPHLSIKKVDRSIHGTQMPTQTQMSTQSTIKLQNVNGVEPKTTQQLNPVSNVPILSGNLSSVVTVPGINLPHLNITKVARPINSKPQNAINMPEQLRSDSNDTIRSEMFGSGVKISGFNLPNLNITKISRSTNVAEAQSPDPLPSKTTNVVQIPDQLNSVSKVSDDHHLLEQETQANDSDVNQKENSVSKDIQIGEELVETTNGSKMSVSMEIDDSIQFEQGPEGNEGQSDAMDHQAETICTDDGNHE